MKEYRFKYRGSETVLKLIDEKRCLVALEYMLGINRLIGATYRTELKVRIIFGVIPALAIKLLK